jgi:uncharacterized protein (DUF1786 family)
LGFFFVKLDVDVDVDVEVEVEDGIEDSISGILESGTWVIANVGFRHSIVFTLSVPSDTLTIAAGTRSSCHRGVILRGTDFGGGPTANWTVFNARRQDSMNVYKSRVDSVDEKVASS